MKAFIFALLLISAVGLAQTGNAYLHQSGEIAQVYSYAAVPADSIAPDTTGMRNITSVELAKELVPGWNVGNSLEAIPNETAWGNPRISQRLIDSVKATGFKTIRIPVAWSNSMDTTTYTINPALMARVEEVVNYVLQDDMYAIINLHWDNGWMQPTYGKQAYVNNRLAVMWRQIALHFRDYNDHLLFAGTNEVMVTGNYGTPTKEYYTVQNSYNQTFVTTVRSTGGCNHYRHLLVQGFNTNIDYTYNFFTAPTDVIENRLMVEVHYYDPYNFTLNAGSSITQWGMYATDSKKTETWANEAWADGQFQKMKSKFIDKGYGVILGEYGVSSRMNLGSPALNAEFAEYRRYYMEYITGSLYRHGLVPIVWDNGYTGNNSMGLFDRATGAPVHTDIIKAMIDAVNANTAVEKPSINSKPGTLFLKQNYPNPFNPSTNISFDLPSETHVSLIVFDTTGREVAALVSEEMPTGSYTRTWNAANIAGGVYFYRLRTGLAAETKKLVLVH
jgi:endoglucanase